MNDGTPNLELAVPQSVREVVGTLIGAIVVTAFLLFFIFLGIYNLFNGIAIIPSLIWLLLVGSVLIGFCKEKGSKQFATEILGAFSLKQFVQTICRENGQNEIQFGYWMFGHRFLYLTVPAEKIDHVNWHTGQASHMAKRDVNDWSVAIWYEHGDPIKSQKEHWRKNPDQEVYIVGHSGRKQEIETFGLALVEFLRKSGATLVQGENGCTFVRQLAAA
jgi:hypothetical protein